jgi:hypothetical protein
VVEVSDQDDARFSMISRLWAEEARKQILNPILFALPPSKPLTRWQKTKRRFEMYRERVRRAWLILTTGDDGYDSDFY